MMAEFRRFDPQRWEPEEEGDPAAKVAKPAKDGEAPTPALATLATLASGDADLPGTIKAGVAALDEDKPPKGLRNPPAWRSAVEDARRIAADGWAAQALSLGWSALDLFGAVPDPDGDPYGDGLATWLAGRRLLALTAMGAVAKDANGTRHYFNLPRAPGARPLWTLGRGR